MNEYIIHNSKKTTSLVPFPNSHTTTSLISIPLILDFNPTLFLDFKSKIIKISYPISFLILELKK